MCTHSLGSRISYITPKDIKLYGIVWSVYCKLPHNYGNGVTLDYYDEVYAVLFNHTSQISYGYLSHGLQKEE